MHACRAMILLGPPETWRDGSYDWSAGMEGYILFRMFRQGRQGGGIAHYVNDQLECTSSAWGWMMSRMRAYLWVRIDRRVGIGDITAGVCYRLAEQGRWKLTPLNWLKKGQFRGQAQSLGGGREQGCEWLWPKHQSQQLLMEDSLIQPNLQQKSLCRKSSWKGFTEKYKKQFNCLENLFLRQSLLRWILPKLALKKKGSHALSAGLTEGAKSLQLVFRQMGVLLKLSLHHASHPTSEAGYCSLLQLECYKRAPDTQLCFVQGLLGVCLYKRFVNQSCYWKAIQEVTLPERISLRT